MTAWEIVDSAPPLSVWKPIELAGPGYADHKPPYDFKHGWIPVSGAAKKATPDKDEPSEDLYPPNLRTKPAWQKQEDWDTQRKRYLEAFPGGWPEVQRQREADEAALRDSEPPKVVKKAATRAPRSSPAKGAGTAALPDSTSRAQRDAVGNPDHDPSALTKEWESAIKQPKLNEAEAEAVHQWQNGFTEVPMGDDEDEATETGLYLVLNDMLRGGGQYDLGALDEEDLENLDLMNDRLRSALDKSRTTRDITVFRGVSSFGRVKVGDVVTDAGWQATSYDPNIASAFLGGGEVGAKAKRGSKTLVIRMPRGSKALRVREREQQEKVFGLKYEVVIGPDTPMKVTGVKGNQIFLEVQPVATELSSDHSSSSHPDIPNKAGKTNWVEETGGLPSFIRRVARHIRADGGLSTSHAIAAAVKQCRDGRFGAKGLAAYARFKAQAAAARSKS